MNESCHAGVCRGIGHKLHKTATRQRQAAAGYASVCCSVLQCVADSKPQPVKVGLLGVLQCVAVYCSVIQFVVCCNVLQARNVTSSRMVCCGALQCVAMCCSMLQTRNLDS